jgi:hypothetical protein
MNTSVYSKLKQPVDIRGAMQAMARELQVELGDAPDAGIAVLINKVMPVTIAPAHHGRIAAFFQIAHAEKVPQKVLISALSEAVRWGLEGETLRFVVLNRYFTLLWTPVPESKDELIERLQENIVTALAIADLAQKHID